MEQGEYTKLKFHLFSPCFVATVWHGMFKGLSVNVCACTLMYLVIMLVY